MTASSSEAAVREAIERLTKAAAARRAGCIQMATHRRPADLGSAVADEVDGATVPAVLLSDLETVLAGFAILPLPRVGEEAVERAHRVYRETVKRCAEGPMANRPFTEIEQTAMRAALSTISPSPGAGVEWRGIESAPTDGQSLLMICSTAYSPKACLGWWQNDHWSHYSRPSEKWHGGVGEWFPTHWQPLRAPPTEPVGEE